MSRVDMRSLKVSWPIRGLLLATIALIAYTWWRGSGDIEASRPPAPTPGGKPAAATVTAASETAQASTSVSAPPSAVGASGSPASAPLASAGSSAAAAPASVVAAASAPVAASGASETIVDLFPSQNLQPPPPPPPPAPTRPPPPPEPPPLPFVVRALWLGQGGDFYAVLNAAGRDFPVCIACRKKGFLHKGDVILDAYRIEEVNRNEVRFTYLPLKRHQLLSLGGMK